MAARILADENIPASVIRQLRSDGNDVLAARESMSGELDRAILHRANQEARLLVTADKDFGEPAFREGLFSDCGVILFRLTMDSPASVCKHMLAISMGCETLSADLSW